MKHPCVEVYFDLETVDCNVRVWVKTDGAIVDGHISDKYWAEAKSLRSQLANLATFPMSEIVQFLEERPTVSAFQVSLKEDLSNFSIVCYLEWP